MIPTEGSRQQVRWLSLLFTVLLHLAPCEAQRSFDVLPSSRQAEIGQVVDYTILFNDTLRNPFFVVTVDKALGIENFTPTTLQSNAPVFSTVYDCYPSSFYDFRAPHESGFKWGRSFDVVLNEPGFYRILVQLTSKEATPEDQYTQIFLVKEHEYDSNLTKLEQSCHHWDRLVGNDQVLSPYFYQNFTLAVRQNETVEFFIRNESSCPVLKSFKLEWSIDRIYDTEDPKRCISSKQLNTVNLGRYASNFFPARLGFDMGVSYLHIQPLLLPPGLFHITAKIKRSVLIHGFFKVIHMPNAFYECPLRVSVTPTDNYFSFGTIVPLTLEVDDIHLIYASPEAGYPKNGKLKEKIIWYCSESEEVCEQMVTGHASKNTRKRRAKARIFVVAKNVMTYTVPSAIQVLGQEVEEFQITVVTMVWDPILDWYFRTEVTRTIQFSKLPFKMLTIRCVINCWRVTNRYRHMLLELNCEFCPTYVVEDVVLEWHVLKHDLTMMNNEHLIIRKKTLPYLIVDLFHFKGEMFYISIAIAVLRAKAGLDTIAVSRRKFYAPWVIPKRTATLALPSHKMESMESLTGEVEYIDSCPRYAVDVKMAYNRLFEERATSPLLYSLKTKKYTIYRTIGGISDFTFDVSPPQATFLVFVDVQFSTVGGFKDESKSTLSALMTPLKPFPYPWPEDMLKILNTGLEWTFLGDTLLDPLTRVIRLHAGEKQFKDMAERMLQRFRDGREITFSNINLALVVARRLAELKSFNLNLLTNLLAVWELAAQAHLDTFDYNVETYTETFRQILDLADGIAIYMRMMKAFGESLYEKHLKSLANQLWIPYINCLKSFPARLQQPHPYVETHTGSSSKTVVWWLKPLYSEEDIELNFENSFLRIAWKTFCIIDASVFTSLNVVIGEHPVFTQSLPNRYGDMEINIPPVSLFVLDKVTNGPVRFGSWAKFYVYFKFEFPKAKLTGADPTASVEKLTQDYNINEDEIVTLRILPDPFAKKSSTK